MSSLSTLAPQYEKMGIAGTNMLLDLIDGREVQSVAIEPKLVMRDSVAEIQKS